MKRGVFQMTMEAEDMIVVFTDEEGNELYYREDLVIEIENKKFAVLVPVANEEGGCGCGEEACEEDVYIARIDMEDGEETYVDPTDEEFEMVRQAYEEILEEECEEDEE
jgi:uncharacterized protein YrzB (UPF0473 family)